MKLPLRLTALELVITPCALAITVAEITGNKYLSPLVGAPFTNLTGLVTAPIGGWIWSPEPDDDESTTESIQVFSIPFGEFAAGDIVTIDGRVYGLSRRSTNELYTTSIIAPHKVRLVSKRNHVEPVPLGASTSGVIGNKDMRPPTEQYNRLDNGNVFGVPNDVARVSEVNPRLEPTKYGMDFFQSLSGELVIIHNVTALGRQAKDYSYTGPHLRVYGNWPVTGSNARGGLTVTDRDANPETIILFDPLDGTSNPNTTKLGDTLTDVTGIIDYIFGEFYIWPLTAPSIKSSLSPTLPSPSALKSNRGCKAISFADYDLEDFALGDPRTPPIVNHIATYLGAPSIIALQGVEDDSGPTDDGTVDANLTLSSLTHALKERAGIPYDFVNINPLDHADGYPLGSNIRSAYLFNPREVRLHKPKPWNSTDINSILPGPSLRFNPRRIDAPPAFDYCTKPLSAQWETIDGKGVFFTVNVQWTSKDGSTTLQSDLRLPWNGVMMERNIQANVTGSFIAQILAQDRDAAVITLGNFNEYAFAEPMKRLVQNSKLQDMDILSGIPEVERYTSNGVFGGQQQLTHTFVSPSVAKLDVKEDYEHVHVNTWAAKEDAASEYDPSLEILNVCKS